MKLSLGEKLPRWLLSGLLCFALDLSLAALLRVELRWWLAAAVLLLWCGLLALAEHFGRFWGSLALWAAALGLCLLLSDREALAGAWTELLSRGAGAAGSVELLLLLLCAAAALPLAALLRAYWARAALSLAAAALWLLAALREWPLPRLIPAALLPLLLLTLSDTLRRLRRGPEAKGSLRAALLLSLLPLALLPLLLPAPAEPYGYPLLHAVAQKVEQIWHDAESALRYRQKGDREFGVSFNGFSDAAALGENAEEESPGVLYVKPWKEPVGPVYLFGNAWDRFDGRGWRSTLKQEDAALLNWNLDTAEHVYALWRTLGEQEREARFADYFRTNSVYLNCRGIQLRTMFTPMNATHIFTDVQRFPYADGPTGSLFDYLQAEEVWYRVYYLDANPGTREALISAAEGWVYNPDARRPLWSRVADDFGRSFFTDLGEDVNLEQSFARREALIRSVYLDRTGLSERAAALAGEITADCGGDYEKALAIAAYLQEHYRYSLSPSPAPEQENFLDWLLFEGQEGYCTWYATAAVLLCRSEGIPARYVQGYRCEPQAERFTVLRSGNAHAWCECYLSGYGWLCLEATPGFPGEGAGWETADAAGTQGPAAAQAAATPQEGQNGADVKENDRVQPAAPAHDAEAEAFGALGGAGEALPARFPWQLTGIAAALPAAVAAVWLWLRARRKRRYDRAEPAQRLLMDLERLLRDLRGKGYPRRPEEALGQYFARLPWHYLLTEEAEAGEMAALYDRSFFGGIEPSEAELEKHRAFAARFRPRSLRQWMIWLYLK